MATNRIQPPPQTARFIKDPAAVELDKFLYLLWQIVRNIDTSVLSVESSLGSVQDSLPALVGHLSNVSNPHNTTAAQVGADPEGTTDTHAGLTEAHGSTGNVVGDEVAEIKSLKAGNVPAGNFTEFEEDGTMVANGEAMTFDDSQSAVTYMKVGGTPLTLDAFDGTIYQYRFDLNDEIHSQIQLSHRYKPGTPIHLHVHLANKAGVGATGYNVGISVEWMWASINDVFPAAATLDTVDCSFQNAAALTHKVFEIATLIPGATQGSISSYLLMRVKRVAGTTESLAGNNIFILGIDVHTEQDTLGSRQEYVK